MYYVALQFVEWSLANAQADKKWFISTVPKSMQ